MEPKHILMQLLHDQRGATAIEYGLICALICMAIMAMVQGVANQTNIMWNRVGTTVQQASAA